MVSLGKGSTWSEITAQDELSYPFQFNFQDAGGVNIVRNVNGRIRPRTPKNKKGIPLFF